MLDRLCVLFVIIFVIMGGVNAAKLRFVTKILHEIKILLTSISGPVDKITKQQEILAAEKELESGKSEKGTNSDTSVTVDGSFTEPNMQHLVTIVESLLQNRHQLSDRIKLDLPLSLEEDKDNSNDAEFLEKLYRVLEENLDNQDVDLDSIAKELYLNRTHFYKKVKALTNQTPFELLKAYRIKKATDHLVNKKMTVNEVYVMTGFKSRAHFSKLFKETYDITPGKYATEMKSRCTNK